MTVKETNKILDKTTSSEWAEAAMKVQKVIDKDPRAHPFLKSDSNYDKMLRAIKRNCDDDS